MWIKAIGIMSFGLNAKIKDSGRENLRYDGKVVHNVGKSEVRCVSGYI
jgi:hypothetical protein